MANNVIEELKASELALAEKTAGLSVTTLEDPNYPKTALLAALGWVVTRRENKELTYEQYADSKTLTEIMVDLGMVEEEEK